jgi:lipoprotein-anchoring transpeptidase ErfK/SrfK
MAQTRSGKKPANAPARKPAAKKPAAKKAAAKPAAKKAAVAKKPAAAKKNAVTLFIPGTGAPVVIPGHTAKLAKERHAKGTSSRAPKGHKTLINTNGVVHHVHDRHITAAKAKTPRAKALATRERLGHGECPPTKKGTRQEKREVKGKMVCRAVKGAHGTGHSKIVGLGGKPLKNGSGRGKVYGLVTRRSKWTEMGFTKGAVGSRGNVMSGRAHHTAGGLTASNFVKSASGAYVSKKASAAAQARFADPKFAHVRAAFAAKQFQPKDASTTELIQVAWAFGSKGASKATSYPAGTRVRNSTGLVKVAGTRWSAYKP